jgi:hypothetical protein
MFIGFRIPWRYVLPVLIGLAALFHGEITRLFGF